MTRESLATFLLNTAWQCALLGALVGVLFALARSLSAKLRYALAALGLLLSVGLALSNVPSPAPEHPTAVAPSSELVPASSPPRVFLSNAVLSGITLVYAAFLVGRVLGLGRSYRHAWKLGRTAVELELPEAGRAALERSAQALDVPRPRIGWSPSVPGPVTLGAITSTIVLPLRLRDEASHDVWTAIFGHELAHVRRRDVAWSLVFEIATLPIAWHPAVSSLQRRLAATREQACDEMVTDALMEERRYARSLVSVAQGIPFAPPRRAVYSIGLTDGASLEERIMRILNRKSTGALTKLSALVAAGSLILVTMGVSSLGIAVAAARQDVERSERVAHARPTASPEPEDEARPYHPRGKRDPFLNPLGAADEVDPVGFDVESLELQGIVQTSGGFTAMVRGPDRKTYFVKRGERFFNGTLVEIDGGSLTFRVHNRDRLGARLTTDVVLPLHPDRPTTAPHASGGLEN